MLPAEKLAVEYPASTVLAGVLVGQQHISIRAVRGARQHEQAKPKVTSHPSETWTQPLPLLRPIKTRIPWRSMSTPLDCTASRGRGSAFLGAMDL